MASINWKQAISGDWSDPANWSTGAVPTAADDATIGLVGNYIVTVDSADAANSLTFDAPGAQLRETASGSLNLAGALIVNNGLMVLDAANTIGGGVTLNGGEIAIGDGGALGSGTVTLDGGELLGTADETIGNALTTSNAVIAAAHGTTLDIDSSLWTFNEGATLDFGAAGQDGTVTVHLPAVTFSGTGAQTFAIRGGTLKAGDADFGSLFLSHDANTVVDAGATLDIAGFDTLINRLSGAGNVTNSGALATLELEGTSTFAGAITGGVSLDVLGSGNVIDPYTVTLTGASSYTGATTIESDGILSLGDGHTTGSLRAGATIIDDGGLFFEHSDAMTISGAITGSGTIAQEGSGTTTLSGDNSGFSGTIAIGAGTLAFARANALGGASAQIQILGGELLGTADETLKHFIFIHGNGTIAAAHGTTLTIDAGNGFAVQNVTLKFGAPGQDGTVRFVTGGSIIGNTPPNTGVEVAVGTLVNGDGHLGDLLGVGFRTTVDAGATLDLNGFDLGIFGLQGAGTVTDGGAPATLTLTGSGTFGSVFGGDIGGAITLDVAGGAQLIGANSYTGTTKIESGQMLTLGNGGTTGSILGASAIDDEGTLTINHSNAVTVSNAISGAGTLDQKGTGTTTVNHANSYSGGTTIYHGTLAVGDGGALGGGTIAITGGELLATANETLANTLSTLFSAGTIAAAHGKTLNVGAGGAFVDQARLTFGAAGQDGTVVWQATSGNTTNTATSVEVAAGTLKAGADGLSTLLSGAGTTTVDAGATLDLAGFGTTIAGLHGAGTVTNTGFAVTLNTIGCSFSGTLSGPLRLEVSGGADLAGTSMISGGVSIQGGTLLNEGTFDLTSDVGVDGASSSNTVTNTGLFEKTAGNGAATVSTPFQNDGTVKVISGSLQFTGGFTNTGIVQGVLSHSGTTWTVGANAPGQATYFGGSGDNHIAVSAAPTYFDGGVGNDTLEISASMTLAAGSLNSVETVQVDNGVTADLSHLTIGENIVLDSTVGGGATVAGTQGADTIGFGAGNDTFVDAPGGGADVVTGFTAGAGSGDKIDLTAFSNVRSFAAVLADATQIGPDTVLNFGHGDTLTMDGVAKSSLSPDDFLLPKNPPHDFNADGMSDVLWQNNDGAVSIWEMNGASVVADPTLGVNPGSSWHTVGTGDFNADGFADMLWQNTDGAVSIWEMNGANVISNPTLSVNPGPSWHAVDTGDFNGDGYSDILWQNTNGAVSIWEMDGTNVISDPTLATNPGPSWHVIGAGDFNGDGKSDILWQNDDGAVSIWEMNGTNVIGNPTLATNPGPSWHAVGTGDFNGDGYSDILWQNTNGAVSIWEMDGTNVLTNPVLSTNPGSAWHVINTADYNGDRHADITLQNTNGAASIWEMNGTSILQDSTLSPNPGSSWHVIGPHNGLTTT